MNRMWLCIRLAFRRLMRSAVFVLSMVIMLLAICGGGLCGRAYRGLRAGFVLENEGELSGQVCNELYKYGFARYDDEQKMREDVRFGRLDCGVSFCEDLEQRLSAVELTDCFKLYVSPLSTAPSMFSQAVCTELLYVAAPYLNLPVLERVAPGVDLEDEILGIYREMWQAQDSLFISYETIDGGQAHEAEFSETFVSLIVSLFLFIIPLMQGCRKYLKNYRGIRARIGSLRALQTVFLPEMLITLLCELAVLAIGLPAAALISGNPELMRLMLPAAVCALICCLLDIGIILVMPGGDAVQILMIPTLLLTLAVCPILFDLSAIIPPLRVLRPLLPTYWLTALTGRTCVCCVLLVLSVMAFCGIAGWCVRGGRRGVGAG